MISRKVAASIVVGSAVGGITWMTESALVAILAPFGGALARVTPWPWLPIAALLLITLGMGIACGLVVCVFTRIPKQFVLVSSICSYGLIEIATWVWLATYIPEDFPGSGLIVSGVFALAHVALFSIGSVVGYITLRKHSLRAS